MERMAGGAMHAIAVVASKGVEAEAFSESLLLAYRAAAGIPLAR